MTARHVVWDWNGTLFDDLHVIVESVNAAMGAIGGPVIDEEDYRDHYARPVKVFYERLLRRRLREGEEERAAAVFHASYRERLERAALNSEARAALDRARDAGATQSLLSMWHHDELEPFITAQGLAPYFVSIRGTAPSDTETKHRHLERHITELGSPDRGGLVLIGDALDDAEAARAAGVGCVLFDGGSHHRRVLEAAGAPVAGSLLEALDLGGVTAPQHS